MDDKDKEIEALEDKLMEYSNRINKLKKSNRNWRRKCQRLRKELKEVKKNGVFGLCKYEPMA